MIRDGARLLDEGRPQEALACFRGSDDSRALFGRAVALHLLGRFEEAAAAYEQFLAAHPAHEEALANLIAMYVEMFDLERVEHYSSRLLRLNPQSTAAMQGLIVVAVERRDYESAARLFARLTPSEEGIGDAVEYRLKRELVDRLRDMHGAVADSH